MRHSEREKEGEGEKERGREKESRVGRERSVGRDRLWTSMQHSKSRASLIAASSRFSSSVFTGGFVIRTCIPWTRDVIRSYLTQCIHLMIPLKSTPPQTRQLNSITRISKQQVHEFVGEMTLEKPLN